MCSNGCMFGYRDCVVEPARGAEAGAEPAGGAEAAEMQIEGGGEAGGLAGAHLEGACGEEAAAACEVHFCHHRA